MTHLNLIHSQTFFLYYVHDVVVNGNNYNTSSTDRPPPLSSSVLVHPEVTVAVLAIIGQMSGALTCYPVGILSDKYFDGRRKPFVYLSCLLLSIGYLTLLLSDSLNQIMGICILLGAANGMYLTMDTSLAVDTLPSSSTPILDHSSNHSLHDQIIHEEDKMESAQCIDKKSQSDPHGAAQLLGVWGVFGFIGSSVGPLIGGMVLFLLGKPDDSNLDSYYSQRGYTVLFSLSAFYFFCAAISLTYIQKKGV
jgi:MFS family permease